MANAVKKVKAEFLKNGTLTHTKLRELIPDLKKNEISMALNYLRRQKYVSRVLVANTLQHRARPQVWEYTYHAEKIA
jgi:predicted transcriptional regulator